MLDVATLIDAPWPEHDWDALATLAVRAALAHSAHGELIDRREMIEVAVRLTSDDAVRALNAAYRQQDRPTNVLSFPMIQPDLIDTPADIEDGEILLGDIVLALDTCAREAAERGITLADHATHLIAHGALHLVGLDHQHPGEAEAMEAIETKALASLGIADPYAGEHFQGD